MGANTRSKNQIYGHIAIIRLLQIASFDSNLTSGSFRILGAIAGYANTKGFCYPSIKKMAGKFCVTRQAIINHIRKLEARGYLKRHSRFSSINKARTTNLYELNIDFAVKHSAEPHIFCAEDVTSGVTSHVISGSYMGMQPNDFTGSVNALDDIKKTSEKNIIEEEHFKRPVHLIAREAHDAEMWKEKKDREAETGLTGVHIDETIRLYNKLKSIIGLGKAIEFDQHIHQEVCGLSALEAYNYKRERYLAEIKSYQKEPNSS